MKIRMQIFAAGLLSLLLNLHLLNAQIPPQVNTIKICALRVQFQPDNNPLTTGNGLFMVDSVTTDPHAIDPAPHDKQYFEDQLLAAANYFWEVSKGRLNIEGDVFPIGEKEAFQLPKKMGDYNPNTTDEEINKGISQLFVDAIQVADQSGQIDFTNYDLVVIFHAGVGRDIELGYDPTPQDIPSLYLSKEFLQNAFGHNFDGVPVNNGQKRIVSGILLPETQNQEGHAIALTGFLVSNIGSYLGLYDLFSPSTQRSAIGRFGLMDAGLLNANGLIPAPPCAFSRILLGWETPVDLTAPANNVELARLFSEKASQLPTVYRVWLNEDEYYLIECRGDPQVNLDSLYDVLAYNRDELPSYKELLTTHFADRIEVGASGVVTRVENYDWGLPGSGILIWHIDQRVIREKGAENKINDDPNWRGVDLEEADGAQDIGQTYGLLDAGYGKSLGWFADFWFKNRPDFLNDFELYKNEFSSTSRPSTVSNWNHALSHIKLYNFSENKGDVMSFDFTREMMETNFPLELFDNAKDTKVTSFILAKHNGNNNLYIGRNDGKVDLLVAGASDEQPTLYPGFSLENAGPVKYLNAMDVDQDGQLDKIVITYEKTLVVYPIVSPMFVGSITFQTWQAPDKFVSRPVVRDNQIMVTCANDSLYRLAVEGAELKVLERKYGYGQYHVLGFSDLFALPSEQKVDFLGQGINSDGSAFLVLANTGGTEKTTQTYFTVLTNEKTLRFELSATPVANFALADLDGNGTLDIVFNTTHQIYAVNTNGTVLDQFPITVTFNVPDTLTGTPIIANLDGKGKPEIVVATQKGGLLAFNTEGQLLPNFPLTIGGSLTNPPALVAWDDDQPLELLAINEQGTLNLWQLDYNGTSELIWPWPFKDVTGNPVLSVEGTTPLQQFEELLPANRVFNYPNPNQGNTTTIRFYLTESAQVMIRIFNLAGERVLTVDMPGQAKTNNEFVWDVSDVASGVYLCQVEAKSTVTGKVERRLFKIMVVH